MTAQNEKFVSYLRCSTGKQAKSGLGIEAQRETVTQFTVQRGGRIVQEFIEVESGKKNQRPKLEAAIKLARLTGSCLIVAKLDRLSRNAAFLMTLKDAGVDFIAADMPQANTMTIGVMALVAQQEAEFVSARTIAALQAARKRGKALGGVRPNSPDISKYHKRAVVAAREAADKVAEDRREIIEALQSERLSLNAMAARLNEIGIATPRAARSKPGQPTARFEWTATAVRRVVMRLELARAA
ncbi:MAG: recombinase family protein [Alphaproteobacteria bacterium]|nr:recombinase family protein [Alphaproteobacteria bacterium]